MSKPKHIDVPQPEGGERAAMRDIRQLLGEGRGGLEQGAYAQNLLAPYLYGQAGVEADYEDRSGRMQELQSAHDAALAQQTRFEQGKTRGEGGATKKEILRELAAGGTKIKGKKLAKYLQSETARTAKERGDLANAPLRIKGLRESAGAKAQRDREAGLLQQEQEMLKNSLSMNNEDVLNADPALRRQLLEEQAKMGQQQIGQFGSLAQAGQGTIGAVQNAAMAQRRAEAISNARRENIGLYQGLQTQQAGLSSDLASKHQQQAALPSQLQQQSGLNFGQLAQGYNGFLAQKAGQRQMQFQANSFNQTQPSIGQSILGGIGKLLQGPIGSGGGGQ